MSRPHQNAPALAESIEKHYPGMKVIAGPFRVVHNSEVFAKSEQTSAAAAFLDQRKYDPKAKLITCGKRREWAWVLRSADGWKYDTTKGKHVSRLGIRAGRGGSA